MTFPKNQKIEPKAPPGHYFWIRLDDSQTDPITLGWWLELRRHRRFWFDKVVLRTYVANYDQAEHITPAYLNSCAQDLLNAHRKAELRRDLSRDWKDYVA